MNALDFNFTIFLVIVGIVYVAGVSYVLKMKKSKVIRYAVYGGLLFLIAYSLFWAFIWDYLVWNKSIYQIIEDEAYNIFGCFLWTTALLVAKTFFTWKDSIQPPLGRVEATPLPTPKPAPKPTPSPNPTKKRNPPKKEKERPFVAMAKEMVKKNETVKKDE